MGLGISGKKLDLVMSEVSSSLNSSVVLYLGCSATEVWPSHITQLWRTLESGVEDGWVKRFRSSLPALRWLLHWCAISSSHRESLTPGWRKQDEPGREAASLKQQLQDNGVLNRIPLGKQ